MRASKHSILFLGDFDFGWSHYAIGVWIIFFCTLVGKVCRSGSDD